MRKIITSESVNIGHPDKTCDTIADAILDAALAGDKHSQMAVECAIKNDKLFIYGEATTKADVDYAKIGREVLKEIGYEAIYPEGAFYLFVKALKKKKLLRICHFHFRRVALSLFAVPRDVEKARCCTSLRALKSPHREKFILTVLI